MSSGGADRAAVVTVCDAETPTPLLLLSLSKSVGVIMTTEDGVPLPNPLQGARRVTPGRRSD